MISRTILLWDSGWFLLYITLLRTDYPIALVFSETHHRTGFRGRHRYHAPWATTGKSWLISWDSFKAVCQTR